MIPVDLGDIAIHPKRLGGYSRRPLDGIKYEVGLCLAMPIADFPLGNHVALTWDGRRFRGQVVVAEEGIWRGSDVGHACTRIKVEGKFT